MPAKLDNTELLNKLETCLKNSTYTILPNQTITNRKQIIKVSCSIHGTTEKQYLSLLKYPYCKACKSLENTYKTAQTKLDKKFNTHTYKLLSLDANRNASILCQKCNKTLNVRLSTFLKSNGCKCNTTITTECVIKYFKSMYDNNPKHLQYDYSKTIYKGSHEKLGIICPKHGYVEKSSYKSFTSEHGCPLCTKDKINKKQSFDFSYFKNQATLAHGDKYYYLENSYTSYSRDITFKCKACNTVLTKRIDSHIKSFVGCPCQVGINPTEKEIEYRLQLKASKNNYSIIDGKYFCKKHGQIEYEINDLYSPEPLCKACRQEIATSKVNTIIDKINSSRGFIVDFKSTNFKLKTTDINTFICNVCNKNFNCSLQSLRTYKICPNCYPSKFTSSAEVEIKNYILSLIPGCKIIQNYRPNWMDKKELDLYLPDFNLAIEYNGSIYHHSSKSKYVSDYIVSNYKDPNYHFNKWKSCFDENVILLSIYDFYWNNPIKQNIIKAKIRHYLQLDKRIYARKCIIKEVTNKQAYSFFNSNHIEGKGYPYKNSKSFGLYNNNTLVMCCTIGQIYDQNNKSFKTKLHRISTLLDHTVVGGISKLSKYLYNLFGSFSYQITLSSGGSTLFASNFYKIIKPRYYWYNVNTKTIVHRNTTQKQNLFKNFGVEVLDSDTENSYMERLGYIKIFDSGLAEIQFKIRSKS